MLAPPCVSITAPPYSVSRFIRTTVCSSSDSIRRPKLNRFTPPASIIVLWK